MAAQPTEEAIEMMINLTEIGRSEAISRLKGNNNDVTQAMNEYFDNPSSTSYIWDEEQFKSDRDGSGNKPGISFQVQGPDDHGSGGYLSGAPSRPPSRASNKSQPGRAMSLADRHPNAHNENRMMANEHQDVDLQKALAESAQEAGLPPQEFGVTNTEVIYFGPATRETYEQNQWGLVRVPNAGVTAEPDAEDRKREDGVPALLRSSVEGNRLPSIISIYHEIPLAREIFLGREDLLADFGHDSQWWSGRAISPSRKNRKPSGGNMLDGVRNPEEAELVHELQRVMAFLDKTERSYGSAEVLTNLSIVKDTQTDDAEGKFFAAWKSTQKDPLTIYSIFSAAIQPIAGGTLADIDTGERDFAILDLFLPDIDDNGELETIYDLTDKVLWMYSGLEVGNSAYITHVADIIGFRLAGTERSRSVKIPEIWYPDRYLESGREAAIEMRKRQKEVREHMRKLFSAEKLLTYHFLPGGKTVKVQDLFKASLMHDVEPTVEDMLSGTTPGTADIGLHSVLRVDDKTNVSVELQNVMASVDSKLKALNEEKQKALASLRELSSLYTEAHAEPNTPLLHKYTLCGVNTNKEVTYIRRQAEPDLIDMDLDATEASSKDQWWRIEYITGDRKPVKVKKVKLEEVLKAAMTESKTCIVVYASEKALSAPVQPLPNALEAFVRADNLAFSAEFPPNLDQQDSQSPIRSPVSPGKRKYDESSDDSVDGPPKYSEQPRWGGQSPVHDNSVVISHRELDGSDDSMPNGQDWAKTKYESGGESVTPRGDENHDVIMGQERNELAGLKFPSPVKSGSQPVNHEMQEKQGLPSLLPSALKYDSNGSNRIDSIDSMDIDEMIVAGGDANIEDNDASKGGSGLN